MPLSRNQAEDLLRDHFGLNRFYDEQWETIENLLNGHKLQIHSDGHLQSHP